MATKSPNLTRRKPIVVPDQSVTMTICGTRKRDLRYHGTPTTGIHLYQWQTRAGRKSSPYTKSHQEYRVDGKLTPRPKIIRVHIPDWLLEASPFVSIDDTRRLLIASAILGSDPSRYGEEYNEKIKLGQVTADKPNRMVEFSFTRTELHQIVKFGKSHLMSRFGSAIRTAIFIHLNVPLVEDGVISPPDPIFNWSITKDDAIRSIVEANMVYKYELEYLYRSPTTPAVVYHPLPLSLDDEHLSARRNRLIPWQHARNPKFDFLQDPCWRIKLLTDPIDQSQPEDVRHAPDADEHHSQSDAALYGGYYPWDDPITIIDDSPSTLLPGEDEEDLDSHTIMGELNDGN